MSQDHYQHSYGHRGASNWGVGDIWSKFAEGDIVHVPAECQAVQDGRIPHGWSAYPEAWPIPGNYRVTTVFSIGEGDEWYYRVSPVIGRRTLWNERSDRLHVIPAQGIDYTSGFDLISQARPDS